MPLAPLLVEAPHTNKDSLNLEEPQLRLLLNPGPPAVCSPGFGD